MVRKRRRRRNPAPPPADPFAEIMQDILGEVRNTVVQGVRQILLPKPPPMFRHDMLPHNKADTLPQTEPEAKEAQVIAIRTSK